MTERTIIASVFSKTYAWTGGRIGYAVFPTVEEAEVFTRLNINYFSCTAPYNQEAAKLALESPLSAPVIAKMVATFEQRRNVIWQQLNDIPGVSCQKPGGAFYLFPNISGVCEQLGLVEYHAQLPEAERQATSPSGLFQLFALYGHRVAVLDRKSFGQVGADGLHFLRLSTASDLPVLADGVRCIRNASEDHAGLRRFLETRPDLQTD